MHRWIHWRKKARRFGDARQGSTAIEFAIVSVPFFLLMFGLIEVLMIGFAQTSLDFAVSNTGREIRTGRVQLNGVTEGEVRDELCGNVNNFMVLTCDGNLFIDVDRYPSFVAAAAGTTNPIDGSGNFQTGDFGFNPGNGSDIIVVRAYYRWEVVTPVFERLFANTNSGQRILISTMMFRNEPFGATS